MQLLLKLSHKLGSSIQNNCLQNPMQTQNTSDLDLGVLLCYVAGVQGYKVGRFGESIHDHPNRIKLASSER
jgi:hypothetical protein